MEGNLSLSPGNLKVMLTLKVVSLYGWQEMSHHNFGASQQLSTGGHTTYARLAQN